MKFIFPLKFSQSLNKNYFSCIYKFYVYRSLEHVIMYAYMYNSMLGKGYKAISVHAS